LVPVDDIGCVLDVDTPVQLEQAELIVNLRLGLG
jgi:hypothetical protein